LTQDRTGDAAGNDELLFLPLGGTGEIGMNLNLYGHAGSWLMIDLGITFADGGPPGIDILMPDTAFIESQTDKLAGLVLTHAHEDHIGAVPHLWPRLRCPVYTTPFTASVLRQKLKEAGLEDEVPVHEVPMSGQFKVGPFEIELITLTHSIPEPNAVVLRTACGTVLHTGDWKLDPDPVVGDDFDASRLKALSQEDILAMVCDSTNALVDGESGSEAAVSDNLSELIGRLNQRIVVTCFASNVARLQTIMTLAARHNRRVTLIGRSMHRFVSAAVETGYLTDLPPFVAETDLDYLPREEVLILCTGSQGERRSALWRIANGEHSAVNLDSGDAVIFSSRIIPGNETGIYEMQNALVRSGVEIYTDDDHPVHVSGHPARDELSQMYQWVRPRLAIPVHGEARHLEAHAKLAAACQVPQQIVAQNGSLIRLAPERPAVIDHVRAGRLALDGPRLLPADSPVLKMRQRLGYNGSAAVTVVVDEDGNLEGDPVISLQGLAEDDALEDVGEELIESVCDAVAGLSRRQRKQDSAVQEEARRAVRRVCSRLFGRKPVTDVHVIRLI